MDQICFEYFPKRFTGWKPGSRVVRHRAEAFRSRDATHRRDWRSSHRATLEDPSPPALWLPVSLGHHPALPCVPHPHCLLYYEAIRRSIAKDSAYRCDTGDRAGTPVWRNKGDKIPEQRQITPGSPDVELLASFHEMWTVYKDTRKPGKPSALDHSR